MQQLKEKRCVYRASGCFMRSYPALFGIQLMRNGACRKIAKKGEVSSSHFRHETPGPSQEEVPTGLGLNDTGLQDGLDNFQSP